MAQQQYGYGYGYQAYNYGQPAAATQTAAPQGQTYGGYSSPAATNRSSYSQNQSAGTPQQQQQPSVGYSSYQAPQSSIAPSPSK